MNLVAQPGMDAMFFPSSIALLGISENRDTFGWRMFTNLRASFTGDLFLVNPRYREIEGFPCYPSLANLPSGVRPDAAVILTSAETAVSLFEQCEQMGIPAAVIIAAGFGEAHGGGEDRAARLEATLSRGRIRLCGPNTIGIANFFNGSVMLSSANIPPSLEAGSLAVISQSGGAGYTFLNRAHVRGLPVGLVAIIGNAIDVGTPEYVQYFASLDEVSTIAIYCESSPDVRSLVDACIAALDAGKTVLMYRAGRTEVGALMAASHTGVLTRNPAVMDEVLTSVGVIMHNSLDELFETAYAAVTCGSIDGSGVAIFGSSGGINVQAADKAIQHGLAVPGLQPETVAFLEQTYPFATGSNPYDPTGLWRTKPEKLPACIARIANDTAISLVIHALPSMHADYAWDHVKAGVVAAAATEKPLAAAYLAAGSLTSPLENEFRRNGVPVFESLDACFGAFGRLATQRNAQHWRPPTSTPDDLPSNRHDIFRSDDVLHRSGALDEVLSKRLIGAYEVPVVQELVVHSVTEAKAVANHMGYPVVMKVFAPDVIHKTEVGGIRLGLRDADEVQSAYAELARVSGGAVVVQPMVSGRAEIFVGGRRHPQLGPIVVVGLGGVIAELIEDVVCRLAPIDRADAASMVAALRGARLLEGFRGTPPLPREPIYDIVKKISWLLVEQPAVEEIDLNPIVVTPTEVVVVDGTIIMRG